MSQVDGVPEHGEYLVSAVNQLWHMARGERGDIHPDSLTSAIQNSISDLLSERDSLTTRLAEVERERDGLNDYADKLATMLSLAQHQLTQAREALERIASSEFQTKKVGGLQADVTGKTYQYVTRMTAAEIAGQALATINREGETG